MKLARLLILFLLCGAASAQCTPSAWCRVYSSASSGFVAGTATAPFADGGWFRTLYVSDTGTFFRSAIANVTTGPGKPNKSSVGNPFSNALFTLTTQFVTDGQGIKQPKPFIASPVYVEHSTIGSVADPYAPAENHTALSLRSDITNSATTASFCLGAPGVFAGTVGMGVGGPLSCNQTTSGGVSNNIVAAIGDGTFNPNLTIDDESVDYTGVTCYSDAALTVVTSCTGNVQRYTGFTVTGLIRGRRQNDGFTAAVAHVAGSLGSYGAPVTTYGPRVMGRVSSQCGPNGVDPCWAPPDRHYTGSYTYDSKRGRLWLTGGWQENWSSQDTQFVCIAPRSGCQPSAWAGGSNPGGWYRVPLDTLIQSQNITAASAASTTGTITTASAHGWVTGQYVTINGVPQAGYNGYKQIISVPSTTQITTTVPAGLTATSGGTVGLSPKYPPGYVEQDALYIPDPYDVIYVFGGLHSGSTDDALIYCQSSTSWGVGLMPATGPFGCNGKLNQWMPVCNTPQCHGTYVAGTRATATAGGHGTPGIRDGARLVWDDVNLKVLIFGGRTTINCGGAPPCPANDFDYTSVAHWDPITGDYCLSDTVQQGSSIHQYSAASCSTTNPNVAGNTLSCINQSVNAGSGCPPTTPWNGTTGSQGLMTWAGPPQDTGWPYFPNWTWDSSRHVAAMYVNSNYPEGGLYTYDPTANEWTWTAITGGPVSVGVIAGARLQTEKSFTYDSVNDMYVAMTNAGSGANEVWELPGSAISAFVPTPTASLSATSPIFLGSSSTLNWSTTDLTSASIDHGVCSPCTPTSAGSISVSPSVTTTYTLTGTGPDGPPTPATATVVVNAVNPNPTASLTATPPSITLGGSSVLTWATANATSASINHAVCSPCTPKASGSISVSPIVTTTYTLTAAGSPPATSTATVTVVPPAAVIYSTTGNGGSTQQ